MCDLLWADPVEDGSAERAEFIENQHRGCSFKFGYQPLKKLLTSIGVKMLIRGHEVQQDGFKLHKWNEDAVPVMCTVFSAPNYCGVYQNKGAVLTVGRKNFTLKAFDVVPSPYYYGPVDGRGDFLQEGLLHISQTVLQVY